MLAGPQRWSNDPPHQAAWLQGKFLEEQAMPSIEIPEMVKFEITANEIVALSRTIAGQTKAAQVRTALRSMSRELYRANKELVKGVLAPLCGIVSFEEFNRKFDQARDNFVQTYYDARKPMLSEISCNKVSDKLEILKRSQAWKKHIPLVRRSVLHLEVLTGKWIADDGALYRADQSMLDSLRQFLDEIAKIKAQNPKKAFRHFEQGIEPIKDEYKALTRLLTDMEMLNEQLRS
jgi:hypothetical protein